MNKYVDYKKKQSKGQHTDFNLLIFKEQSTQKESGSCVFVISMFKLIPQTRSTILLQTS